MHLVNVRRYRSFWTGGQSKDGKRHENENAAKTEKPDRKEGMSWAGGEVEEAWGEAGQAPGQHQAAQADQPWRAPWGTAHAWIGVELGHCHTKQFFCIKLGEGRQHWCFRLKAWLLLTCSAVPSLSEMHPSRVTFYVLISSLLADKAHAISRPLSAFRVNWSSFWSAVAVILLDNRSLIGGSRFFPSHKFTPQGASSSCKVSKFLPISPKVHRNFLSRVNLICLHSRAQNTKIYVDVLSLFSVIFITNLFDQYWQLFRYCFSSNLQLPAN